MSEALALVLNFDAELELDRGASYQPTRPTIARMTELARKMRSTLPEGAFVIAPLDETGEPSARSIAWCLTARARKIFAHTRRPAPDGPDQAVIARVNARPFAHALSEGELSGAVLVHDLESAERALARPGAWLLKRVFGVSGHGQRPVRGGEASLSDRAFIAASLARHGAIVIEPRVRIERELSVHAWRTDATHVRSIREQVVDAYGAFTESAPAKSLAPAIENALVDTALRVGDALGAAGYRGPFGIDAYLHRGDGTAPLTLRTLSEINARYCMGWDERDGWLPP